MSKYNICGGLSFFKINLFFIEGYLFYSFVVFRQTLTYPLPFEPPSHLPPHPTPPD